MRTPISGSARTIRSLVVGAGVAALLAGGCSNDVAHPDPGRAGVDDALPNGGWIGGAPSMGDDSESYGYDGDGEVMASAAGSDSSGSGSAERSFDASAPTGAPAPDSSPLRAGNVDDNADFEGFLAYLGRIAGSGVPYRALDVAGRIVVSVRDVDDRPVAGAAVRVAVGQDEIVTLRTTADGTTRFHPRAYGPVEGPFTISAGGESVEAAAGTAVTVRAGAAPTVANVPLDIAFAIDVTGSMGDELDRMKESVGSVVDRIEALPGSPDVRLAMTAFRDEGDSFVTATHDFTSDIGAFRAALDELQAGGGGDTPEALDEAVADVLSKPAWRPAGEATQLVFVIGDAGGHPERNVATPYTEAMKDAATRGIKIIPIAASSTDDQAEVAFRQMAQFTGARFVFLAYGAGGAATGTSTDIASTDYEELSLDDLIVRLVADELAARTGTAVTVPTTATPTTNPPGQ